ncbi:MAG TPA: (S)-ureidoglycine aminohydrolase [Thermomicrobiales bacterium]|nr:(S)-ureidoglycine aminohydrolase [Thermomicrobiales bacterium]
MILPPGVYARNRAVVTAQYAVMPPEGVLESRLPGFQQTVARILAAPPLSARFAQILLEIAPGGGTTGPRDDGLEHVFYLLGGAAALTIGDATHRLAPGGYAYVPAGVPYQVHNAAAEEARLLWIKRPYEPIDLPAPAPLVGRRDDLERVTRHTDGRYWQHLLPPGDLAFDFEVNILGFAPGVYFPYVETHIMEHSLYMLEGQGIYLLAGDQREVQPGDFIWMAPYCPQFFFCTGWQEAAYLLYKDVNRDVRFG